MICEKKKVYKSLKCNPISFVNGYCRRLNVRCFLLIAMHFSIVLLYLQLYKLDYILGFAMEVEEISFVPKYTFQIIFYLTLLRSNCVYFIISRLHIDIQSAGVSDVTVSTMFGTLLTGDFRCQ